MYCLQCSGAATFSGGSGYGSPRSRGACYGSDQTRLALDPTPCKKRQLQSAPALYTKFFHLKLLNS